MQQIQTSIKRPAIFGFVFILFTVVVSFVWITITQINSGTVAKGKVIPIGENKIIQHQDGGTIKDILVHEGQKVVAGQELIVLEPTSAKANLAIYEKEYISLFGLIKRLKAEQNNEKVVIDIPNPTESVKTQLNLFEVRKDALKKDKDILEQRKYQTQQEIKSLRYEKKALETMFASTKETVSTSQELYDKRYEEKRKVLENINKLAQIESEMGRNDAEIHRAEQKITEIELQIRQTETNWLNSVLQDLSTAQDKLDGIVEKVTVAKKMLERNSIVSPVDGIIKVLHYKTISGVIPPAKDVVEIVPLNNKLIIEAQIEPNSVTSVKVGLKSFVKFTAFNRREIDTFEGKVTYVSADTFTEPSSGVTYYKALVELDDSAMKQLIDINLQTGMLAQVEIALGTKSVLRYLLDPLLDSMHKAFKER